MPGYMGSEAVTTSKAEKAFFGEPEKKTPSVTTTKVIGGVKYLLQEPSGRHMRPGILSIIGDVGEVASPTGIESVIGADQRVRIFETEQAPWRMICALQMRGPDGVSSAVGTGWFVGPRTIITAGHCVFHKGFFGGWASDIEISPGRDGADFPFGSIHASRFSSTNKWIESMDPDFDIGCIHLDEPIGEKTGWFSVASLEDEALKNKIMGVSGYPGDRGAGTEQYFHAERIVGTTNRRVFYSTDTAGGQSGAPVWLHSGLKKPPMIVGIHAYGADQVPGALGKIGNSAPRIIPEVFKQIAVWIDQDS